MIFKDQWRYDNHDDDDIHNYKHKLIRTELEKPNDKMTRDVGIKINFPYERLEREQYPYQPETEFYNDCDG
jgi:hypothetical protein